MNPGGLAAPTRDAPGRTDGKERADSEPPEGSQGGDGDVRELPARTARREPRRSVEIPGVTESPQPPPAELLTLPEAAILTGLSVKALTRRIERGTLPSERHQGRRLLRRGELQRLQAAADPIPGEGGAGEVVIWRELYENERQERELAVKRARDASAPRTEDEARSLKPRRARRSRASERRGVRTPVRRSVRACPDTTRCVDS